MTAWRDSLLPASFRGVAFFVTSAERTGGRRGVDHEIPFSEAPPPSEDLGLKGRGFSFDAFVIGDDYQTAKNALLTALELPEPGELVHPYYGTKQVNAREYRVRESGDEGGLARFGLTFTETSTGAVTPTVSVDGPAKLAASAATLKTSAGAEFIAQFDELANLTDAVADALSAATAAVSEVLDAAAMPGQTLAELTASVVEITDTAATLLDAPSDLVDTLTALVEDLGAGLLEVADAANPLAPLLALFSTDLGVRPPDDTPARLAEQVNFDATSNLWKRLILGQAALMAIEVDFVTYDDAVATREAITDLLDGHVEAVADDVYPALQDVRRDLVQAVPGEDSDLPRLVTHTPVASLPSLVLAHNLYGHLDLEEDLIRRNRIANPGVVVGGVALEVLSDE